MGTLVLGFPMLYPGAEYGEDPNQFKSGFLLEGHEGQLYSHAIPLPYRARSPRSGESAQAPERTVIGPEIGDSSLAFSGP